MNVWILLIPPTKYVMIWSRISMFLDHMSPVICLVHIRLSPMQHMMTELLRVCGLGTICEPQISGGTDLSIGKSCTCLILNISIQSCRPFNCMMFHIGLISRSLTSKQCMLRRGGMSNFYTQPPLFIPGLGALLMV